MADDALASEAPTPVLDVAGLTVEFPGRRGSVRVVDDVSLTVRPGEIVGLVGESGSGKSVTSLAILGLTRATGGRVVAGRVAFEGTDLTGLDESALSRVRGRRIGMIFQQPTRSLDPAFTVGAQVAETIRRHERCSRSEAWARGVDMLERVRIPDPARRARQYPHEFSGGMCQRAMIAIALSCNPALLIADEPTTALDATVQRHVLDLLLELRDAAGISILLITHDIGVIAEVADSVSVMYAGQILETGAVADVFGTPGHPYSSGLMQAVPQIGRRTLVGIAGNIPDPANLPIGCRFHPRCHAAVAGRCDVEPVELVVAPGRTLARCVRAGELALPGVRADVEPTS